MSWEKNLLPASFRGIEFDIIKTDDSAEHALVEHSYPYVDGSDVEDMGRGARRISVQAIFYGDDYEARLNEFLKALDGYDARYNDPYALPDADFIHPVFGEIKVKSARYAVHHEAENVDQADVTVEFIESTPGNPFFDAIKKNAFEAISAKSALAKAAAVDKHVSFIDKLRAFKPLAGLQALRAAITGPLLAAMDFANAVLANMDVLAYPRAWANDFESLINGALDIRDWGAAVMSEWSSIQATFSLLDIFYPPSTGAQPDAVDTTSASVPTEEQAIAVTQVTVNVFVATALADAAALAFSAIGDAQAVNSPSSTSTEASDANPAEIEAIASTVRAAIDAAIERCCRVYSLEDSRAITEPLKDLALAIQDTAAALIEARPPLVQRTITAPANMRLVAHRLFGDHTRSAELYRLNGARSPFLETGEMINAYAK